jgi:hypothetical protein
MQSAAAHAVDVKKIEDFDKYDLLYDVVELGKKGQFRSIKNNSNNSKFRTIDYFVEYNPKDIYVYGGCALTLYDIALHGLKRKHGLNALEMRVRRKTTDIDLVWFPRVPDVLVRTGHMVTSQSPAIKAMVSRVKEYLTTNRSGYQRELQGLFREKLGDRYTIDSVDGFSIDHKHMIKAGVHSIEISCDVNGMTLKLCEMSIHDSGSSQQYNENHKKIPFLQPMTEDPIYCPPNEMVHVHIHNKKILVPNIILYCKQQLFIVGNKLRSEDFRTPNKTALDYEKALGSFYRVAFVLYLLESLKQNQRNVSERVDVENIGRTIDEIHEMINHVKQVFRKEIKSLCSIKINDEVGMLLCGPLKQIKGLPSYAMSSHSMATKKRQTNRNVTYEILTSLKKSINNLILSINRVMGLITHHTPMNQSPELLKLQRDAWEIHGEVMHEFNNPSKNHRNLYEKVEELRGKINGLYDKYYQLANKIDIQSLHIVSTSSAQLAALPPRHPSISHLSASRSSHNTRKNANKN